jgi:hypothetical protein
LQQRQLKRHGLGPVVELKAIGWPDGVAWAKAWRKVSICPCRSPREMGGAVIGSSAGAMPSAAVWRSIASNNALMPRAPDGEVP